MKTGILVCFLLFPLVGTAPRTVPPVTAQSPASRPNFARTSPLAARLQQFGDVFRAGDLQAAAVLAQQGYQEARRAADPPMAARFLSNLGSCRFLEHQYQEALEAYLQARDLAESAGNLATAGALDFNISALYSQLGQIDAAAVSAERALARLAGPKRSPHLPKVLIHLASLRAQQDRMPEARALFHAGIAAADRAGDAELYAYGWDRLGEEHLKRREYGPAEGALLAAYLVRKLNRFPSLEISYRNLGRLRLEQGDLRAAGALLDQAVERAERPGGLLPAWSTYYYRGRVRLAEHQLRPALADLRTAVRLARVWRRATPPGDATRVGIENWDDVARLYASLVDAGNQLYFEGGDAALAQETFVAAEENRAASLRALLAEPRDWRRRLPPAYWDTLRKLESAEVQLLRAPDPGARARMQQLQSSLLQFEMRAGSNPALEMPALLSRLRRRLGPDEALLSFHLASPDSYLWAVSRGDFALYRLPASPEIAGVVGRFTRAVRTGAPDQTATGRRLFRTLFGPLAPAFQRKPHWLLALDAQLFDLPLAALVVENRADSPVYLVARHSLETTPGAGMLVAGGGAIRESRAGPFVGIADPVYNRADPRWPRPPPEPAAGWFHPFAARAAKSADDLQLARLAGSAREVEACARAWGGSQPPQLLQGPAASRSRIEATLNSHPAVLHFATHVLHSVQQPRSGLIVLSLNDRGQNEVLSAAEIATWRLEGALVSLSGCSSASADAFPGTGLMGLTRAWLAAGAAAVVATRWPATDDAGTLFSSYYGHLRRAPRAGAAVALQRAQLDMIRSQTWRSAPRYWGAYLVAGK